MSLTFGENVQTIGDYAFTHCSALQTLKLPKNIESIGRYAFVGCSALTSVCLPENLKTVGDFAFASLSNVTFYTSAAKEESGWGAVWNASYRPVFWDCEFSSHGYLVSYTKGEETSSNFNTATKFSAPLREGYSFLGWATEQNSSEVAFTLEQTGEVPDGTALYAVWAPAAES